MDELYQDAATNCFRYLGYTSFSEVDRLTLPEYQLMMKAVQLREADKDYRSHAQAFLNFAAQGRKRNGKPVYTRFEKFYDREKALRRIQGEKRKQDRFAGAKIYLREKRGGEDG